MHVEMAERVKTDPVYCQWILLQAQALIVG